MTGYVLEKIYFEHQMGPEHPESPKRLKVIEKVLQNYEYPGKLKKIIARPATEEEITSIHTKEYFEKIKQTEGRVVYLDPDTSTSAKSFEAAVFAAGGVLSLIDAVFTNEIENGFAFVRPPGHHAEKNRAMGFCLFNNIAIGAAYALKKYNLNRIMILDFDLHHGNGTQQAFYESKKVFYISTHQYPYYPGTGSFEEVGEGEGLGYNLNFPLSVGKDDHFYNNIFQKIIYPISLQYKPELVLVSVGFDIYFADPLGGMKITENGFSGIINTIMQLAKKTLKNGIICVLEGGYSPNGIKTGVKAILNEMTVSMPKKYNWQESDEFANYLNTARQHYNKFWKF